MLGFSAIGQFALGQGSSSVTLQLVADAGAFTLTGQSVNLLVHRRLYASNEVATDRRYLLFAALGGVGIGQGESITTGATTTFSLRGESVGLYFGHRLAAGAASFALTGFDVTLRATRMITAGTGSFTLTGLNVGLVAARRLVVGAGAFVLTGFDAGFNQFRPRIKGFSRAATAIFGRSLAAVGIRGRSASASSIRGRSTGGME